MELSLFLAKVMGLYLLAVGIALLLNQQAFKKYAEQVFRDPLLILFKTAVALIIGVLLINVHNVWVQDWRVVITIIGWTSFVIGLGMIVPKTVMKWSKHMLNENVFSIASIVTIIIGAYLSYVGFYG